MRFGHGSDGGIGSAEEIYISLDKQNSGAIIYTDRENTLTRTVGYQERPERDADGESILPE